MTLLGLAGRRWAWGAAVWLGCAAGFGQALPATASDVLVEMAGRAGVIFTGQVTSIARADASGYVDTTFKVETAVRGVGRLAGGGGYVLREWAGLWIGQPPRYSVGQRYLMLLTARGSSGMSAPVGGMDGAIPLVSGGDAALAHGTGIGPADAAVSAPEAQVDLRWLAARAVRSTAGAPSEGAAQTKARVVLGPGLGPGLGPMEEPVGPALPVPVHPMPIVPISVEPGSGEAGWTGAIAPLPSGATASPAAITAGTKLSAVLALLSGAGSAHVSR